MWKVAVDIETYGTYLMQGHRMNDVFVYIKVVLQHFSDVLQ
jgi:hypothetical protein